MFTRRTFHIVFVLFLAMILIMAGCCLLPPPSPKTYTITATAGVGGSISPLGVVTVNEGTNLTFTITPAAGYQVSDVLIEGVSAGAVTAYTFTNVQQDHTISASFAQSVTPIAPVIIKYTITATAGTGGSITPEGTLSVNKGSDQVFTIEEDAGYQIADVLVDGVSVGAVTIYIFDNVSKDHTIEASFIEVYTLTMSVIGEGTTTPAEGTHTYPAGTVVNLTATSSCLCYSFLTLSLHSLKLLKFKAFCS